MRALVADVLLMGTLRQVETFAGWSKTERRGTMSLS